LREKGRTLAAMATKKKTKKKVAAKKKPARAPKKAAPKKKAARAVKKTKRAAAAKKAPPRRRDRAGHLDPKYAADLRRRSSKTRDDDRAFVGGKRSKDDLAEELAEEAVVAMTSGEDGLTDDLEAEVSEEIGGPFVRSSGKKEFARGTDKSNPRGAKREPFPTT
jgi:hypothetical protein